MSNLIDTFVDVRNIGKVRSVLLRVELRYV